MWQRSHANTNSAAGRNVLTKLEKEECVLGMGHRRRDAAGKNALIMPKKEEFA